MKQIKTKCSQICFRRWKRTSWAAFASLGKVIKIGVLSVTYSVIVFKGQPLQAQTQVYKSGEVLQTLDELIIGSERPTPFQPLVRVTDVIQRHEIERSAVQNLQDLLHYIQGVDIRSRGSEGVQADLNILGGTFDQSIIMLNGINFTDPQTGHHSMNIPVDISQIERIEILQGPGAWSEGSIAYSGAVNIITKNPEKTKLHATLSGGSFNYLRGGMNLEFAKNNKWQISGKVGGGYSSSSGYSDNTDFDVINTYTNLSIKNNKGDFFRIQAGFQQKAFGANSFYSLDYPEQFESTKTFLSSFQYLKENERWQLSVSLYQRAFFDRFELFRNDAPEWYGDHNYHRNDVIGASAKAARRWGKSGTTVAGAEWRYEHIYSNLIGDPMDKAKSVPFENNILFTRAKGRQIPSFYLRHILNLKKWCLTGGIMISNTYNEVSAGLKDDPSIISGSYGSRIYAGITAAYAITPYLEANGWLNNSYRNPSFTDLYYNSPTQKGNPGLKPEEAVAAQFGLRYTKHNLRASISGYYRYGYRIIDWTREPGADIYNASNLTNVTSKGVELGATYIITGHFFNSLRFSYAYLDVNKESGLYHSTYSTDFLRHKALFSLDHKIISKLTAKWDLSFQKREGSYPGKNGTEIPYKGFVLADLKIVWNGKMFRPFIEASNLFNTEYLYLGNLPQPGRWIKAGIVF